MLESNCAKHTLGACKIIEVNYDATPLEAQIDAHVAHLYNLTKEEYSLICKETNRPDQFRLTTLNVYRDIARERVKGDS